MDRVSDEWLARRIVAFDEMRCGDSELHVSSRYAQAMLDALRELQERRAADAEQVAPQGDPHGETYGEACCRFTKEVDEMRRKVAEALGVCEEAAPTEPRLAKWERRLGEMRGTVEYDLAAGYEATGEGVKWYCADTAKAAVKAAWKAWREARDEH